MAWNKPSAAPKPQPKKPSAMRGIAAGLVVVAVAVACIVIFMGREGDVTVKKAEKKPTKIKTVTPAPAPKAEAPKPEEQKKPAKKKVPRPAFADKPFGQMTSLEKAQMMHYWLSDTNNVIKGIDMSTRVPPPVFSNSVMNGILPYINPGADVIPFGPIKDAEARKAIDEGVTFNFDDPLELLEKKQFVKETLEELRKYMDAGGHAVEFFEKLDHRQNLEHTAMATCREEVMKLRSEGRLDEAKETMDAFNNYLREKRLPELHINLRRPFDLRRQAERQAAGAELQAEQSVEQSETNE